MGATASPMAQTEMSFPMTDSARLVPHMRIGGVPVAQISRAALIARMFEDAPARRTHGQSPALIFDANGHGLSMAAGDAGFREALHTADLVHADGGIIVAASRLLPGGTVPDRSATTDMYLDSLPLAAQTGCRYYLLGGKPGVASDCADRSVAQAPGLVIAGAHHGYFSEAEEDALVEAINAAEPDVIWVGLGKPKEQAFCLRNRSRLKAGWLVTCGGLFNYVTGDYPRAPQWMQRWGLEWMHRLATNPRHLFWRYLTTNPHALWLIATRSGGPV